MQPFLTIENNFQETVRWTVERLSGAGLEVVETFNLKSAVPALAACGCPYHGTDMCDCQMVVLLIYENGHPPTSMILHGQDRHTWFSIVDSPQQRANARSESMIQGLLKQQSDERYPWAGSPKISSILANEFYLDEPIEKCFLDPDQKEANARRALKPDFG